MTGKFRYYFIMVVILTQLSSQVLAGSSCYPRLGISANKIASQAPGENEKLVSELRSSIKKYLAKDPNPIAVLASAGKISIDDFALMKTRKALQDADHAAVIALLYALTSDPLYFNKSRDILLAWSQVNQPTGNPIDETRLEGMVWAYDLISCSLELKDKKIIEEWLERLREKKETWNFGPVTASNNHRINQLKMMLLIDKALNHSEEWEKDLEQVKKYEMINLDSKTGESLDYRQRHALHYHNYDLKAWIEINLISACCQKSVAKAFSFLADHIKAHQINGEFVNSEAKIDVLRSNGGFTYAKIGGNFDVTEAAPTILAYYTMMKNIPDAALWEIVENSKHSPWLSFLSARRDLWNDPDSKLVVFSLFVD